MDITEAIQIVKDYENWGGNPKVSNEDIEIWVKKYLDNKTDDTYKLVLFPEIQEYMDKDWFNSEAILYQTINEEQDYLSSAYFIPSKYIK